MLERYIHHVKVELPAATETAEAETPPEPVEDTEPVKEVADAPPEPPPEPVQAAPEKVKFRLPPGPILPKPQWPF